jgi:hypothetical protein
MPRLSSLDLIIFAAVAGDDLIEIETFQSLAWQQFNPVAYWYDIHAQQHTLFTLPYKFNRVRDYFDSICHLTHCPCFLYSVRVSFKRFYFNLCIKKTSFTLFQTCSYAHTY